MTKNPGQASADLRAVTLHMLALQLLEATRDADHAGKVSFNDHGILTVEALPIDAESEYAPSEADRDAAIEKMKKAFEALLDSQDSVLRIASDMDALREWLPGTIDEALRQVVITQERYASAATDYIDRLAEWQAVDSLTGRTRQQCVKDLVAGGMAATPADKAASDHPTYTAHKDRVIVLANAKDEADVARDVARLRATNARATLDAMLAHPALFGRHRAALTLQQGGATIGSTKPVEVAVVMKNDLPAVAYRTQEEATAAATDLNSRPDLDADVRYHVHIIPVVVRETSEAL